MNVARNVWWLADLALFFYSYCNSLVNTGKGYASQVIIGRFNYKVL